MGFQMTRGLKLFCLLAFTSLFLWSLPAYSADRFQRCHQYDRDIESAVSRWWGVYDYPLAWKAQLYQESLCNPNAVSPAGASGLAQFMPSTWRDMEKRFGTRASPHSDIAIDYGAYYMAQQMRVWKAKRPQHERWRLGLAGYNAGTGNILKAQKKCDNASLWSQIKFCLHLVTRHHSNETKTYVERIERWWQELAYESPWKVTPGIRRSSDLKVIRDLQGRYTLSRYFSGRSWCTYWQPWLGENPDTWISADHCHQEMGGKTPPFVEARIAVRNPLLMDAVIYSTFRSEVRPRKMKEGEDVYILGYPGGSDEPSLRRARVYYERQVSGSDKYSHPATIILIETPRKYVSGATYEPVIGGMSGGLIASLDYEPLGVLVTQNALADLTGDGIPDSSADAVQLHDIWGLNRTETLQ